jgi:hypothetical protein
VPSTPHPEEPDAERPEHGPTVAGLSVLCTVVAPLQWIADENLWSTLLYTAMAMAVACAASACGFGRRRRAGRAGHR